MVKNNTAHAITIVVADGTPLAFNSKFRKYVTNPSAKLVVIPADTPLNASANQEVLPPIEIDGVMVPMKSHQTWVSVDPVPEDGDFHIVSALYLAAANAVGADTSRLLTIGTAVVDEDGRMVGCAGLQAAADSPLFD